MPRLRAASMTRMYSGALFQTLTVLTLMCECSMGMCARSPMAISSSSAEKALSPSSRMCVM